MLKKLQFVPLDQSIIAIFHLFNKQYTVFQYKIWSLFLLSPKENFNYTIFYSKLNIFSH